MPLYIYRCDKCVLEIEKIQGMGDKPPLCPNCGGEMIKKLSSPAIIRVPVGGIIPRSKGYKEGYSKEYLRDVSPETQ